MLSEYHHLLAMAFAVTDQQMHKNQEIAPELDAMDEADAAEFDSNLAEQMEERDLARKAQELVGYYENDEEARSEWKERYKEGLKTLDPDGGLDEGEDERGTRGLSVVVHPLIAEAATQFNAKAIAELYPSGGPVKSVIIGNPDEKLEEQGRRVREFMNYQITQEMPEYFPDLDQKRNVFCDMCD
eukprot:gene25833-16680_t